MLEFGYILTTASSLKLVAIYREAAGRNRGDPRVEPGVRLRRVKPRGNEAFIWKAGWYRPPRVPATGGFFNGSDHEEGR